MVEKWHQCISCGKHLSSYHSLWRHKKSCKGTGRMIEEEQPTYTTVIPTASGEESFHPKTIERNPKIQALVDEIVDNGITYSQPSLGNFEKTDVSTPALKKRKFDNLRNETPTILRESMIEIEKPPRIMFKIPTPSRTKKSLVDYSDTDDTEDTSDGEDDESDDGTIGISDIPPPDKVEFMPETIDGLRARFEVVLKKIAINRSLVGVKKRRIETRLCSCWTS